MSRKRSMVFLVFLTHAMVGMNAFAVCVVALSFVLGFGTPEQRWDWVGNSALSLSVLLPLMVMVRHAERRERDSPPS